jgi:plasmid stability protein
VADLLIRGLDDLMIKKLKERAARHMTSLNSEVKDIITREVRYSPAEFAEIARRSRERTGFIAGDSTDLVREDRDNR